MDEIDGGEKLTNYLKIKLSECELKIKKYKAKYKKIKYTFYAIQIGSILIVVASGIVVSLTAAPALMITILAGIGTGLSTTMYKFGLEDKKNKINKKIIKLNEIRNYIQYVNALNGELTQEKINEILQNV